MNPLSAPISSPINRSIRRLYCAYSAELFVYTMVTQVNGVSYVGWVVKEEDTNFVKILQLPYLPYIFGRIKIIIFFTVRTFNLEKIIIFLVSEYL